MRRRSAIFLLCALFFAVFILLRARLPVFTMPPRLFDHWRFFAMRLRWRRVRACAQRCCAAALRAVFARLMPLICLSSLLLFRAMRALPPVLSDACRTRGLSRHFMFSAVFHCQYSSSPSCLRLPLFFSIL